MKRIITLSFLLLIAGCNSSIFNSRPSDTFRFGIIADVQYADKDTRKRSKRSYRQSIDNLKKCVEELNRQKPDFVIQVGDIIDGNKSKEKTLSDLDATLKVFNELDMPKYHVVGNHCLTAGKKELGESLGLSSFYYDFTVPSASGWRFIVLDGNDAGYGIVSEKQLKWLKSKLDVSKKKKEKVIIFNHFPLLKKGSVRYTMKKSAPVLDLINNYPCVVAHFSGHYHGGGYVYNEGIHHVTVKGMVENKDDNAFAIIEVTPGMMRETGFGKEPSREMKIGSETIKEDILNSKK